MSDSRPETIPVDSLVIARKVMPGSRSTLEGEVRSVVKETGLDTLPVGIREERHIAVNLIGQVEYAGKKLLHPRLAVYSVMNLAERFNDVVKLKRDSMTDFVSDVAVGEAQYDNVSEGLFVVGFMMSDGFKQRISRERTEAIDTLLDTARLPLTDPFRQWRNEDDPSWLPVLRVSTTDPCGDDILEDFTGQLSDRTASLAVDIYDARARVVVADLQI